MTALEPHVPSYAQKKGLKPLQLKIHNIIYEADTFGGMLFDVLLIASIIISVIVVMLESVSQIRIIHGDIFRTIEWVFTILFTIEYIARIMSVKKSWIYIRSFYGVIDLLSIIPTYLSLFVVGVHALLVIRVFRLLRMFRIFKMAQYVSQARMLSKALKESKPKIVVFLTAVVTLTILMGAIMHLIEGPAAGFTSIPKSMYWAIVTLTTVGFGDVVPVTIVGQFLAGMLMILGYGIIAVPTGIVSVELIKQSTRVDNRACTNCGKEGHELDAKYCKHCGESLDNPY